jgi:asparagine synthase (glutamine-hydrolysing)
LIVDPITPALIEKAVWHLDEPMTDLSTIPFYLICQQAREHVTVCLSGEGGDEVLVGYDRFKASKANAYYALLPEWLRRGILAPLINTLADQPQKKGPINLLKRFIQGGLLPEVGGHMRWQYFSTPAQDAELFSVAMQGAMTLEPFAPIRNCVALCDSAKRLDQEIYVDLKFTMPDSVLMKVDKMSMAHALEYECHFWTICLWNSVPQFRQSSNCKALRPRQSSGRRCKAFSQRRSVTAASRVIASRSRTGSARSCGII